MIRKHTKTTQKFNESTRACQTLSPVSRCYVGFSTSEQAKAGTMPDEDSRWLQGVVPRAIRFIGATANDHNRRSTVVKRTWAARAIRNGQLVPQRDDLQMQRRA